MKIFENLTEYEKQLIMRVMKNHSGDADVMELVERYNIEREATAEMPIRRCEVCGVPMKEGYVMGGCDFACSDECFLDSYGNIPREEAEKLFAEDMEDADEGGDSYWTEWDDYFL